MMYVAETPDALLVGSCASVQSVLESDATEGVYTFYNGEAAALADHAALLHAMLRVHRVGTRRGFGVIYERAPNGAPLADLANLAFRAAVGAPAHVCEIGVVRPPIAQASDNYPTLAASSAKSDADARDMSSYVQKIISQF